mmetsp:Transcript_98794/g.156253  ORF Transcript_98794/g.156253 Transcript_98794/m.156253 type:complete len:230 (-) Transcript_98794:128-817(-)
MVPPPFRRWWVLDATSEHNSIRCWSSCGATCRTSIIQRLWLNSFQPQVAQLARCLVKTLSVSSLSSLTSRPEVSQRRAPNRRSRRRRRKKSRSERKKNLPASARVEKDVAVRMMTRMMADVKEEEVRVEVTVEAIETAAVGLAEVAAVVVMLAVKTVMVVNVTAAGGDSLLVAEAKGTMVEMSDGATARGVMVVAMEVAMRAAARAMEAVIGIATTGSCSSLLNLQLVM